MRDECVEVFSLPDPHPSPAKKEKKNLVEGEAPEQGSGALGKERAVKKMGEKGNVVCLTLNCVFNPLWSFHKI